MKIPISWEDAGELLGDPVLPIVLKQRLVHLAFGGNETVALRATEMLANMPRPSTDTILAQYSDEEVKFLKGKIDKWLEELSPSILPEP